MKTSVLRSEPVFMIGQIPFVAGTIIIRNQMRRLRQRRRARQWQRFAALFRRRPSHHLVTWRRRGSFGLSALLNRGVSAGRPFCGRCNDIS